MYAGYGEAEVPELQSLQQTPICIPCENQSRLLAPAEVLSAFAYAPDIEPFTDLEQLVFAQAFKETPKEMGKIASLLKGRSEKDCIHHYYASKWDARFKIKSSRQLEVERDVAMKKAQKAAAAAAKSVEYVQQVRAADCEAGRTLRSHAEASNTIIEPMELVSKAEVITQKIDQIQHWDPDTPPIDQEIVRLNAVLDTSGVPWREALPSPLQLPIVIQRPDLAILRRSFTEDSPFNNISDNDLLKWLRSATVLPLLSDWYEACLRNSNVYIQLQRALPPCDRPWDAHAATIASFAQSYRGRELELAGPNAQALQTCARYTAKLCNSNGRFLQLCGLGGLSAGSERYLACARVLLMAFRNLTGDGAGFFGVLLRTELTGLVKRDVRPAWEEKYLFEGEEDTGLGW
ncbi:hypothetical protein B0A50_04782 [Salinomyces thailandicus]|uniref:SANT domain-containing protein n=1 Tax=Salinomyces thailandicus TaxID=706561 RepID=A0A4U0TWJ8_9PEZI|nr:hypothetical protein B0A50_04782 [Salinomyces thailandica]